MLIKYPSKLNIYQPIISSPHPAWNIEQYFYSLIYLVFLTVSVQRMKPPKEFVSMGLLLHNISSFVFPWIFICVVLINGYMEINHIYIMKTIYFRFHRISTCRSTCNLEKTVCLYLLGSWSTQSLYRSKITDLDFSTLPCRIT